MKTRYIALVLALAVLAPALPARAHGIRDLLQEAGDLREVRRLERLHVELHRMLDRYAELEREAGRARLTSATAHRAVHEAQEDVREAKTRLDERVRAAYEFGPAGSIEAILGASSFADVATINEFTRRTISIDQHVLRESVVSEVVLTARRARAEAAQAAVEERLERLRTMLDEMQRKVDKAREIAERAQIEFEALQAQAQLVADAASRAGSWGLGVIDYGQDQSHLLALLGPTGGRTCETPAGLVETGEAFEGYASWYGWEFGGQPTATGAIFDPRLFTAANRWLPFGSFLRVRHGDRCAIVLINDRGPYGQLERVIDLSEAAADYLGVGVSWVHAEILVPAP
jgi:hypothetical protein